MGILREAYKSFFGKEDDSVWRQFAEEKKGKYAPVSDHRVLLKHKEITIAFGAYTHYTVVGHASNPADYTRGFVEFSSKDDFTFCLRHQGFFENVGKLFGMQDIEIGDSSFDKQFIIKSNDEMRTSLFLSNSIVQDSLQKLRTIRFEITNEEGLWGEKPTDGNYMLYFVSQGKITKIDELNNLHQLFVETIDMLIKTNSMKVEITRTRE